MNALYQITPYFETMQRGFQAAKKPESDEAAPLPKAVLQVIQCIRSYLF
ncbi:MAG: hypothetical protein AB7J40_06255 [Candidatus Altimarinota bacterium]